MPLYPKDLTSSDWIDFLAGKPYEDQIAALATYHRRIEYDTTRAVLHTMADPDPAVQAVLTTYAQKTLAALEPPADYRP